MNKTLAIVQEWVSFETQNPDASVADFCRAYLDKDQAAHPSENDSKLYDNKSYRYSLTKIIYRISRLWMYFTMAEIKSMGLTSFDEFIFLLTVQRTEPIRKKDLIYMHFIEISSGILIIDRLIKKGFLNDTTDERDKRSKLVTLTKKGETALADGHDRLDAIIDELYIDVPESAMKDCFNELKPVMDRAAERWYTIKKFMPVIKEI